MKIDKNKIEISMAKKCISHKDLCARVGLPQNTFTRVLRTGVARPITIGLIAKALEVDVDAILLTE